MRLLCLVALTALACWASPARGADAPSPAAAPPAADAADAAKPSAATPADPAQDRAYIIELRRPARATSGRTHVQLHLVPPSMALLRPARAPPTLVQAVLRPVAPPPAPPPAPAAAAAAASLVAMETDPRPVRAPPSELHVHKPYSAFAHPGPAPAFTPAYAPAAATPTAAYAPAPVAAPAPPQTAHAPAPAYAPHSHFVQQQPFRWEDTHINNSLYTEATFRGAAPAPSAFYGSGSGSGGRGLLSNQGFPARPTAAVPPPLSFHPQPAASAPSPAYAPAPAPVPAQLPQPLYQQQAPQPQGVQPPLSPQRPGLSAQASEPAAAASPAPANDASRSRATLRQVLHEDCPDSERLGFCASPPRYPSHQVSLAIHRCRELLSHLYVPLPDEVTTPSRTNGLERASREAWSWARNASVSGATSSGATGACASESARVLPGYARDATGRWLVVVQAAGLVVQPARVDVCRAPGQPCPALAKCASLTAPGRRGPKKGSWCEQRFTPHHVVTWDPDAPERCPRLSIVMLPTACSCRLPVDS